MSERDDYIREDFSVRIRLQYEGEDIDLLVSPKFDRIDYFPRIGNFILKVIDAEEGFVQIGIDEQTAFKIQEAALLPIVPRDEIFRSEYEFYLRGQERNLEDMFRDQFPEME